MTTDADLPTSPYRSKKRKCQLSQFYGDNWWLGGPELRLVLRGTLFLYPFLILLIFVPYTSDVQRDGEYILY